MLDICVMIPVYNNADTLERCIKSVNSFASKIIVVDGIFTGLWAHYAGTKEIVSNFSTDKTEELCKKFEKVIFVKELGPPGTKLNYYLDLVPDECYLVVLDADEVLIGMEKLIEFLGTGVGKMYGNFSVFVYHLYNDFKHYINMDSISNNLKLRKDFCYFSRIHYYRKGFRFHELSSEGVFDKKGYIYLPAPSESSGLWNSYCIPKHICKILHHRFLRSNVYQQNRVVSKRSEGGKDYVTIQYGENCIEFPIKELDDD